MSRHYNLRSVRIHRNYTYGEISRNLHVSKKTIRNWIVKGLPVLNDQRPFLIQGKHLIEYLKNKRIPQRPCELTELYCFKCKKPQPASQCVAEYLPMTSLSGQMKAQCPSCKTTTYKNISLVQIDEMAGKISIHFPKAI